VFVASPFLYPTGEEEARVHLGQVATPEQFFGDVGKLVVKGWQEVG
jgi:hypothetical protein